VTKICKYYSLFEKLVDEFLGKTLVKKLATFAQHRLDYKIPTLAMAVLKRIAEELNMSLLSCLGRQDTEFRDLLLQRLEFKCEDVNLKVCSYQSINMCMSYLKMNLNPHYFLY